MSRLDLAAKRFQAALESLENAAGSVGQSLDSAAKVALLERAEKMARAKDPRIVQVMAGLAAERLAAEFQQDAFILGLSFGSGAVGHGDQWWREKILRGRLRKIGVAARNIGTHL